MSAEGVGGATSAGSPPTTIAADPSGRPDRATVLRFAIPSLLGVLIFLTPVRWDGIVTIPLAVFSDTLRTATEVWLPTTVTLVLTLGAMLSTWACLAPLRAPRVLGPYATVFVTDRFWLSIRLLGAAFAWSTLYATGPEWVRSVSTGGVVLNDLCTVIFCFFFFAALLLPLLSDFGLMEVVGAPLGVVFRPLFRLPGRSAIDALASWLGSGTVGVLITTQQYKGGYYTQREACTIATNFSIASIAFAPVVIAFVDLEHMFPQFYATVVVTGLLAALITPRLPPLSRKPDTYDEIAGKQIAEDAPEGMSRLAYGFQRALGRARGAKSAPELLVDGTRNLFDIWFGLMPVVMALGTIALAVSEFTPVFDWLSAPLVPLLELLRIPEAAAAAPAFLVGFADMFLAPAVGASLESDLTRFVIACLTLTQLVFMTEIGVLILKSKIDLGVHELFGIFLLRTLICLPPTALMAHLVWF